MDTKLLEDIGLTKAQADVYVALVGAGASTAAALASTIGESRSNTYKLLDRLCLLGLATKDNLPKVVVYYPVSPTALSQIIDRQEAMISLQKRKLDAALPAFLNYFFTHSEQPGIHFYQGKEGIRRIFSDILKTGKPVCLVRSPADVEFYDEAFFADFRKKRARLGITTYALTPDIPSAVHDAAVDAQNRFIRTWIAPDAYTASVEWDIYGDKVALISYGHEAIGVIIESPHIAESFRQIFGLLRSSLGDQPR